MFSANKGTTYDENIGLRWGKFSLLRKDGVIETDGNAFVEVPDVLGLSISAANRLIVSSGLNMRINGSGIAVTQSPEAGEMVLPTAAVTVTFCAPSDPVG